MSKCIRSKFAHLVVMIILLCTVAVTYTAKLLKRIIQDSNPHKSKNKFRLLITGTFYHIGWFRSHILPLAKCEAIEQIFVICDESLFPVDKVIYCCPPRRMIDLTGHALARFLWTIKVTRQMQPDLLMGYHIMPNALICLVTACLFGKKAVYQMTGGAIQVVGGGSGSENILLRQLGKPSRIRELLLYQVIRQFDCVVVRGRRTEKFVRQHSLSHNCLIVPGSVDCKKFSPNGAQIIYDLVTVGRLVPVKRIDRLLDILAEVINYRSDVRLAIVGDGPLMNDLQNRAKYLGLMHHVDFLRQRDDIAEILSKSRVFIITSESESLSIAMIEAMAAGLPAIVPDIGDLGDLVIHNQTGLFINPNNPEQSARTIHEILNSAPRLQQLSKQARQTAIRLVNINHVAHKWRKALANI